MVPVADGLRAVDRQSYAAAKAARSAGRRPVAPVICVALGLAGLVGYRLEHRRASGSLRLRP